ncbi:MAG: RluA family pseudouridine synthase [Phycisphaerales bacterium]
MGHQPLQIVHADRSFAVIDKPAGLLSVPGRRPEDADSIQTRARAVFPDASGPITVHRLDMDTSGLIVVGLTEYAQRFLSMQFERRRVEKQYTALVRGLCIADTGRIDLPLRVDWPNRPKQIVCHDRGKPSATLFRVLSFETDRTRLLLTPITGRTHQLRVHLASPHGLGRPILGDRLYGERFDEAPRLMLHASRLCFRPPGSRRMMEFVSTPDF